MEKNHSDISLQEVHGSVPTGGNTKIKRFLAFAGPAYLVSVGYMDPGNWATDLAGGSKYGYALIWVLLMSNLMALLLQSLSARLGIVRRRDLAQANRETYPRYINISLYVLAEIAIAACDLAEVLGMAIGIHLLTGIPILWGVLITILDTFLLLILQRLGMRKMEAFIIGLIFIIGICFLINIILASPPLMEVVKGLIPSFPDAKELYAAKGITAPLPNETALYLAIGIIGATVMPHNLYLHSALVQTRKIGNDDASIKRALKNNFFDSAIALNLAFFVNAAILILAATVFFKTGRTEVAQIEDAHLLLAGSLGTVWAPRLFAIALIAAGQSSTITGTLAGQIIMEGYLRMRMNPWVRRLLTRMLAIIPAVAVILIYGDDQLDTLLIFSQVILSLQLGFAIIPLIHFVSDKKKMGIFTIKPLTKILSWLVAGILVYLNLKLLTGQAFDFFKTSDSFMWKALIIVGSLALLGLLVYVLIFPWLKTAVTPLPAIHQPLLLLRDLTVPVFNRIAVALDFTERDEKIIAYALSQGHPDTLFTLIHIVESAAAKMLGASTADQETKDDADRLLHYAEQLEARGFKAVPKLGFKNRVSEIVRLVTETEADMLVIGSHGHSGLKDYWHGETINAVRHAIKIPVLIVNL
ncbi:MAG: Nramp family divalent metal transporter [Chitinophagaceae bacterium]